MQILMDTFFFKFRPPKIFGRNFPTIFGDLHRKSVSIWKIIYGCLTYKKKCVEYYTYLSKRAN